MSAPPSPRCTPAPPRDDGRRPAPGASAEARARQLITELRPDSAGPLGWRYDAAPPRDEASSSTMPVRVQTSVSVPAVLPGAFAAKPRPTRGTLAADRVAWVRQRDPEAGATLTWLQRHGTLRDGIAALHLALAGALAVDRSRWGVTAEQQRVAAEKAGRKLLAHAETAWWGTWRVEWDVPRCRRSAVRCDTGRCAHEVPRA